MKQEAAADKRHQRVKVDSWATFDLPLTAAGFWVRVVRVVAASYFTAWEEALSSSKMQRM